MQTCYFNGREAVFVDHTKNMKIKQYSDIRNKLSLYLNSQRGKVTMKKIQSRFKEIKNYSCSKWAVMCAFSGFAVHGTELTPSNWFVSI